jgi:hypothetical protein
MNSHQKRTLQSFRRVQNWIATRPELASNNPAFAAQSTEFDTVVASVGTIAAEQETHRRGVTAARVEASALRKELFQHHIRPVAAMARVVIPDIARMTVALRAPSANIDAEGLIAAAESMAQASERYTDVLVKRGLPADFVAQLRSATKEFRGAIDAGGEARGGRRGATKGLMDALGRGRKLVSTIGVLVTRALRNDPQALAEWQQITRVTVKGAQPDAAAVTPPAAAAPATAVAAATPAEQKAA